MKPGRKPGIVSFIVVTLLVVLLLWAGIDGPKELFVFLGVIFLWFVWFSGWRRHRKLAGQIEELQAAAAASREPAITPTLAGAQPQAAAASAAVAPAPATAGFAARPAPALEPSSSPPPPPPPMPPAQAAANLTFAQVESAAEPGPSLFERLRSLLKFEEMLGTNWMAKIGALILVLGVAFFLAWQLREVGPAGKVTAGWLVGVGLLGTGIFFERQERYRIIARAAVAAGWAIAFFTAFAMNHIKATRVLDSALADLGLMLLVAAAMVVHTLRYRSQVATGLAFLSAFVGLFASVFPTREFAPPDVYGLTAAVVLATGVAVVALRMQWFVLEVCAIVATFLHHFVWLIHIIRPMGKHHHAFPEFLPSAGILVSYWVVYRVSYLVRRGQGHERISALAALLNTSLLLAVLKYQAVHPEYAFWTLLVLGAIELGLGQLRTARQRQMPHIVLTVIGACLLMTAIPFRIGLQAHQVSLIWLAAAETFFLVGVLTPEKAYRRAALSASGPLGGYSSTAPAASSESSVTASSLAAILGVRMDGPDVKGEFAAASIAALVALVLCLNIHWSPRRWAAQF